MTHRTLTDLMAANAKPSATLHGLLPKPHLRLRCTGYGEGEPLWCLEWPAMAVHGGWWSTSKVAIQAAARRLPLPGTTY